MRFIKLFKESYGDTHPHADDALFGGGWEGMTVRLKDDGVDGGALGPSGRVLVPAGAIGKVTAVNGDPDSEFGLEVDFEGYDMIDISSADLEIVESRAREAFPTRDLY